MPHPRMEVHTHPLSTCSCPLREQACLAITCLPGHTLLASPYLACLAIPCLPRHTLLASPQLYSVAALCSCAQASAASCVPCAPLCTGKRCKLRALRSSVHRQALQAACLALLCAQANASSCVPCNPLCTGKRFKLVKETDPAMQADHIREGMSAIVSVKVC